MTRRHFSDWPRPDALKNCAMFAVDRNDFAAAVHARPQYELAAHDERFLVCERDSLSSSKRCERCR